jgi:hypothetical protein
LTGAGKDHMNWWQTAGVACTFLLIGQIMEFIDMVILKSMENPLIWISPNRAGTDRDPQTIHQDSFVYNYEYFKSGDANAILAGIKGAGFGKTLTALKTKTNLAGTETKKSLAETNGTVADTGAKAKEMEGRLAINEFNTVCTGMALSETNEAVTELNSSVNKTDSANNVTNLINTSNESLSMHVNSEALNNSQFNLANSSISLMNQN